MVSPRQLSQISILVIAAGVWMSLPAIQVQAGDGSARLQPVPESQPVHSAHCPSCQHGQQAGNYQYGAGHWHAGGHAAHCPNCRHHGHGAYGANRHPASPGTGWCAPGKIPIVRERVQYWQYYPNYWSGYGPGPATPYKPAVYTPTDTAQLGYYYQHAPSWTSQPWRVPGPPHPAYWHNRACGNCKGNQHPGYGHYGVPVNPASVMMTTPTPVENNVSPPQNGGTPQTILIPPGPDFKAKPSVISSLPDAPPEV